MDYFYLNCYFEKWTENILKLIKLIDHLESLEVVDEDVWQPELIDQLEVDRNH